MQVNKTTTSPLWSIIIPTFNCADYLAETLKSVLIQDPGPEKMEIIVVDDCSTKDNPKETVDKFGNGRVTYVQQSCNVGKSKNYATGIRLAKGEFIHILHGDDTIEPGFYRKIESLFSAFPEADVAFCQNNYIDKNSQVTGQSGAIQDHDGLIDNFLEKIATWQLLQPPSVVFKRQVYETIGGYDTRLKYMEDWELYVRAAVHYKWAYTSEVLANYRIFSENSSSKSILKGKRLKAIKQVMQIINTYLPKEIYKKIQKPRREAETQYLLLFIPILIKNYDFVGYLKTISRIITITPKPRYFFRALKLTYLSLKANN